VSRTITVVPFVTPKGLFINEMCGGVVIATHGPLRPDHAYELETRGVSPPLKNDAKRNRKLAIAQEDRVAEDIGGRRQPASGALEGQEGDVRKIGSARIECKWTYAGSYVLKLDTLVKVEREAGIKEVPVLVLDFRSKQKRTLLRSFAIVPYEEWLTYMREKEKDAY